MLEELILTFPGHSGLVIVFQMCFLAMFFCEIHNILIIFIFIGDKSLAMFSGLALSTWAQEALRLTFLSRRDYEHIPLYLTYYEHLVTLHVFIYFVHV